ncbi:MAG: Lar family restriction alleviation protein [Gammaproteobacteria bacterium]|nr:Lar family restriction alleviation protein [Gammaproteobacteria bacterium]
MKLEAHPCKRFPDPTPHKVEDNWCGEWSSTPERDDEDSMRPCPFCQSLDLTVAHVTNRLDRDASIFQVACEDCGARGPHAEVSRHASAEEMDAAANREWNDRLAARDAEESA